MNRRHPLAAGMLLAAASLALTGCASRSEEARLPGSPPAGATAGAHPVRAPVARGSDATLPVELSFPQEWIAEEPAGPTRAFQFRLPGEAGDGELVVYWFAGGAGTFEQNAARWASQIETEDGSDPLARARFSTRRGEGLAIYEMALEGTYVAETRPGSGERVRIPDSALRAAVLEAGAARVCLKLVGPRATVAGHERAWRALLSSARPAR